MTSEEYQWHIHLIKDRYFHLNNLTLSDEQAALILQYEEDKDIHSDKHFFSDWEGWDFELSTFRNILEADQLKIYEEDLQKRITQYTTGLIEDDANKLDDIKYHEELLTFYKEQFLPPLCEELRFLIMAIIEDRPKIDFLKAAYKDFLEQTKKEMLIAHFRFYRTFKPNELKNSLLRNQIQSIWPNYAYFKQWTDDPTRAVASYLENKFQHYPEKMEAILQRKFNELEEFTRANLKKYFKERQGGWAFAYKDRSSSEEQMRSNMMCFLLLEKGNA